MSSRSVPDPNFSIEKQLWRQGMPAVAGVDEAGRGCLAGPVFAASVILLKDGEYKSMQNEKLFLECGIRDSKLLSAKAREELAVLIKSKCVSWCVSSADSKTVDKINILQASFLAMGRSLEKIQNPDAALIDGSMVIPPKYTNGIFQRSVVKGDRISLSVAAASILAKVARDAYMVDLSVKYPLYGFESHKGYGSKQHIEALDKHGLISEHRMSYAPVKKRARRDQLDFTSGKRS